MCPRKEHVTFITSCTLRHQSVRTADDIGTSRYDTGSLLVLAPYLKSSSGNMKVEVELPILVLSEVTS
jgi:hypothetical protein